LLKTGLCRAYEWLVFLLGAVYFVTAGVLFSLFALLVKPFVKRRTAQHLGRYGMHLLTRIFFAGLRHSGLVIADFDALDKLRDEEGVILAPNHPCLMDALFITSKLSNVVCVMKGSISGNPIFFGAASLGEFIRSDTPMRFMQLCQRALSEGGQLLLFPEGTRTVTRTVNPFKGGFALLAQKTGAPIQTLFIEANTDFLGKRWFLFKKPDFPLVYRITLGKKFYVDAGCGHKQFTIELQQYFKKHLSK